MRIYFIDGRSPQQKEREWREFIDHMQEYMDNSPDLEKEALYIMWKEHLNVERFDIKTLEEIRKL